jgi:hypothetical protein
MEEEYSARLFHPAFLGVSGLIEQAWRQRPMGLIVSSQSAIAVRSSILNFDGDSSMSSHGDWLVMSLGENSRAALVRHGGDLKNFRVSSEVPRTSGALLIYMNSAHGRPARWPSHRTVFGPYDAWERPLSALGSERCVLDELIDDVHADDPRFTHFRIDPVRYRYIYDRTSSLFVKLPEPVSPR